MKKTVRDVEVRGKTVIVRCDFNVPLDENKNITDDIRITSAMPTINYLVENDAKVILMSHLGRPKGEPDMKYSLAPVAKRLEELLGKAVTFISAPEVVNEEVKEAAKNLKAGDVMLLENVRFRKEETSPRNWLIWRNCLSTTRSVPRTELTLPPQVSHPSSPVFPVS